MNFREILVISGLALAITYGIDYLFWGRNAAKPTDAIRSGQSFVAPKVAQELKPLNTEVDFFDQDKSQAVELTRVETDHAPLEFTTSGAALERLEFKRERDGKSENITTIHPVAQTDREKKAFLVALERETPYFYTLTSNKDDGDVVILTYDAVTPNVRVTKVFTVYKHVYKIDLAVTIAPLDPEGKAIEARVFFPAPIMPAIAKTDIRSALIGDEHGSITAIARASLATDKGWFAPTFFGADNIYFVHAMVADSEHFVQRGYYSLMGHYELFAIVEGPAVTEAQTWTLSFYCGPKEEKAMAAVDLRLEQTLGHAGWLAPLSNIFLKLLIFLYGFLGNYGLAIIALTILIKILLLPFTSQAARGMKKHGQMQKKMQYLQQKYKYDPETLELEKAESMRKEGLGSMLGCLPMLLQIPVFLALNRVLSTSVELYQAPFAWISDLSAIDPYYILPVIILGSMVLIALSGDAQQRMSGLAMALIFGAISAYFSAGLGLYFAVSNILTVMQTSVQKMFKAA